MSPQRNTGPGPEAELPEYAGHYRLESCLGSGGMGVVHLARGTTGMKLAVKVVHADFAKDPEFRGRFRQEVAAARRVSGAFTAPVVDADPEAERPWMATLYIPGPTLSDHVKRNGPMPPAQLRRLMAGLAEALRDIHRVGVVHRDLKPSNVLLAEDGPKVIDFGISRPKDSELRTETGKLIGTPPFMAPEQFRRPREVGSAADVFALGSVIVHAATGRGPFDSDSPYVVAYQVVHDDPDLTGVPEDIAPLVLRCLAKEPEDRPTPDELMRELRSTAASYDTQAFIPAPRTVETPEPEADIAGPKRRTRRPSRRVVLAGVAIALVIGAAVASALSIGGPAPASDAITPPKTRQFHAWVAKTTSEGGGAPQCSFGSGKLLCSRAGQVFALDPFGGSRLWRHTVADANGDGDGPPVLSGGLVQPSTGEGRHLEALDPSSGRSRWERTMPALNAVRASGDMLLVTGTDGKVTGVDAASGKTKWDRRIPGHSSPYFTSFAGDPLAYTTNTSDDGSGTRVTAVDPRTGDVRWDKRLDGRLEPFGTEDGSVYFLSVDSVYGETKALVSYDPVSGSMHSMVLPVRRELARATVNAGVVYLLAVGGSLEALDLDARKLLWHLETSVSRGSTPVADSGNVYFSSADGRLLAFDADKGRLIGQTPPRLRTDSGRVTATLPEPVIADGHVYATAPDGTVFAVDGRDPSRW
ncbi:serine/threonine-protein kinase [Streptomyces sp. NPDC004362]|uniref:serine/threonine-protein kinase n=1 Tax=Streptomyces sp. NPDC004362 TaxID=3154456 RepID=UPI0033AE9679